MTAHRIGSREEWLAARRALLQEEKELTRRSDELARQRRELPWLRVEREYTFDTEDGPRTLAELFDGRSQLLVYHFMFGPQYSAGCPTCSSAADSFDGAIVHLNQRDVTMVCASRAPLEKLLAYRRRMGWRFPWVSSAANSFNYDFGVSFTEDQQVRGIDYNYRQEQLAPLLQLAPESNPLSQVAHGCGTNVAGYLRDLPGLSAFALEDGVVYHTYSCFARGGEFLMGYYGLLDRVPKGRNEGDPPEHWIRRKDEYAGAGVAAAV